MVLQAWGCLQLPGYLEDVQSIKCKCKPDMPYTFDGERTLPSELIMRQRTSATECSPPSEHPFDENTLLFPCWTLLSASEHLAPNERTCPIWWRSDKSFGCDQYLGLLATAISGQLALFRAAHFKRADAETLKGYHQILCYTIY